MTPEEAREIDRLAFEAEAQRIRQIAYAMLDQNRPQPVQPKIETKPAPKPRPERVLPPLKERPTGFNPQGELLTAHGLSLTRSEWARHLSLTLAALGQRLKRKPLEEALSAHKSASGRPRKQPHRSDKR